MDMDKKKRVLVAMSGGVDSSVSAKLLLDAGYEVAGATMHLYSNEDIGIERTKTCCSLDDVEDAREVAYKLGIPFHVFNFADSFKEQVTDKFVQTYLDGGTPNPCVDCNRFLKFGKFLDRAQELGFDYIATGHYVTKVFDEKSGRWLLRRSADVKKDQTYVLYSLTQQQLAHSLFPVGENNKDDIRAIADQSSLVNAQKPDSQDICFIPDGDYAAYIERLAGVQPCGDIVLSSGEKLGTHRGLIHYTIGQRRGVGVSYSEPIFVVRKDTEGNRLVLGRQEELLQSSLTASDVNFLPFDELNSTIKCTACTRYHQKDMPCVVTPLGGGRVRVDFEQPHKAVCKGQAVVFYDGDFLIGGGTIE